MFQNLRDRLRRTFSATTPPPPDDPRQTAETARADRAGAVVALRAEVRELQQAIKDGTDALEGLAGKERAAQEERLASLGRQLEQKQRELGGYQARV